jgi:hypothetical protein
VSARTRPSKERIVAAQADLLRTLALEAQEDPIGRCWTCSLAGETQRAHIKAARHDGTNDPANFFLLCALCHAEQPDAESTERQLAWLRSHESSATRILRRIAPVLARFNRGEITEAEARALV